MSVHHPLFFKLVKALKDGCSEKSNEFRNFVFSNSSSKKISSRIVVLRDFIGTNNSILLFRIREVPRLARY